MPCKCELRRKIKSAAVPWIPERTVYLDYNATTPVDPRVIGAFERACRKTWGNPSSLHSAGTAGWNELEILYDSASSFFGTDAEGFHLCSSGTDALSAAIYGTAGREKDITFITSAAEHQAVRHPLFHLARRSPAAPSGFCGGVVSLPVDEDGKIDLQKLKDALRGRKKTAVVISPVNHETGAQQPIREIAETARSAGAIVILDAVQAAARLSPEEWAPYCDIFCISGHKLYAPKGTALLWRSPGIRLRPLRFGGAQEGGLFPGTENTAGGAALSEALKLMKSEQKDELRMLKTLQRDGLNILEKAGICFTIESPEDSVAGILCISLKPQVAMQDLIFSLNSLNICISRFSACSDRIDGRSRILDAMGRPALRSANSIRISCGRWSRRDDFHKLAAALKKCGC
ncbi:MAG: aminotransferase class V-fold PLP-dependent enzyme [Spirochaetales bacterium]|nr:aminotransferase class V-fold PLP-dependent enzyme [Spirochaetales bacterium]